MGLKLMTLREVVISVTGGDLCPTLNGEPLAMWRTHLLVEGDVVHFKKVRTGCRAYLAVNGGFVVPRIMESSSTYLSGKFGGMEGRTLKEGDILYSLDLTSSLKRLGLQFPIDRISFLTKDQPLREIGRAHV